MKLHGKPLLFVFCLFFLSAAPVFPQATTPPKIEGAWSEVTCPFDASKALLPVTCGRLKVPENYDDPKGRSVEIVFMVVKARRNIDPKSPVMFINGGPGQTSLYDAEILVTNPLIHDVVVGRDWVFFDQRGTGRSIPQLYCPDEPNNPFDLRKCRDDFIKQGIDLSQYNTARIASDMEALRKALGVHQWNLWGNSYGPRVSLTMARYHPSSVRSMIHDAGSLPDEVQERVKDAHGTDGALNKLFSKCAADAACSSKFPQLRSRFTEALTRLRQQPLSAGQQQYDDGRVLRFIRAWLYPRGYSTYEQRIQNLLIFMDAAARGDGQVMFETQQRMRKEEGIDTVRPPEPIHARFSVGQSLSVYCNEREPFESIEEYQKAQGSSEILRALLQGFGDRSDCALWPAGRAERIAITRVYYDGPQLVFTGELDASSSGQGGYKIEMVYANARNVVFKNGYHGQFRLAPPNSEDRDYWMCALRLGNRFLADPQQKPDTSCAETRKLRLVR